LEDFADHLTETFGYVLSESPAHRRQQFVRSWGQLFQIREMTPALIRGGVKLEDILNTHYELFNCFFALIYPRTWSPRLYSPARMSDWALAGPVAPLVLDSNHHPPPHNLF